MRNGRSKPWSCPKCKQWSHSSQVRTIYYRVDGKFKSIGLIFIKCGHFQLDKSFIEEEKVGGEWSNVPEKDTTKNES